jgi:tryptophanyl-tRNA synthetase
MLKKKYAGVGYGVFKNDLVAVAIDSLTPVKRRYEEIRRSSELKDVLEEGAERANVIAVRTMARVKEFFGLGIG